MGMIFFEMESNLPGAHGSCRTASGPDFPVRHEKFACKCKIKIFSIHRCEIQTQGVLELVPAQCYK